MGTEGNRRDHAVDQRRLLQVLEWIASDPVVLPLTDTSESVEPDLDEVVEDALSAARAGATVCVNAPPRFRAVLRRRLAEAGLEAQTCFFRVGSGSGLPRLVATSPSSLRYSLLQLGAAPRFLRWLVALATSNRLLCRAIERFASDVVVVVMQGSSERPAISEASVIVQPSPTRPGRAATVFQFDSCSGTPVEVIKMRRGSDAEDALRGEADALGSIAWAAAEAGVRVPALRRRERKGDIAILALEPVQGEVCARLLRSGRITPQEVVESLQGWLKPWAAATVGHAGPDAESVCQRIQRLADEVAPHLPEPQEYRSWIRERITGLSRPIPNVAAHNDLTVWNLLWRHGSPFGVVDWETATAAGTPTADFAYLAVDAQLAWRRDEDRLRAFHSCFGSESPPWVGALHQGLASSLALEPSAVELCFHACWLHHARNEISTTTGSDERPFLQIASTLSRDPGLFGSVR